ncbi:hypothetical protein HPB52_012555 [Rhipicephalus sanguineus]|uniref:Uncharacterized protein n=1 Tax=Rhipicephalus sanguineus TaxID=34632 RepID=A0A9D4PW08_RHISA|nr:hypothetical protein HPB52_012555 [Rhipicephalus sanguineus]
MNFRQTHDDNYSDCTASHGKVPVDSCGRRLRPLLKMMTGSCAAFGQPTIITSPTAAACEIPAPQQTSASPPLQP